MIEKAILAFVHALNTNWAPLRELESDSGQSGLVADWAQASWESIVEASIPVSGEPTRLVVYGDGADCHPRSSRFSSPNDWPTHEIRCNPTDDLVIDHLSGRPLQPSSEGYSLDRFVSLEGTWYVEGPPFDHALIERNGLEHVVAVKRLTWILAKLDSGVGR